MKSINTSKDLFSKIIKELKDFNSDAKYESDETSIQFTSYKFPGIFKYNVSVDDEGCVDVKVRVLNHHEYNYMYNIDDIMATNGGNDIITNVFDTATIIEMFLRSNKYVDRYKALKIINSRHNIE